MIWLMKICLFVVVCECSTTSKFTVNYKPSNVEGYFLSVKKVTTPLVCSTYCPRLDRCGGISYSNGQCQLISSNGTDPIPADKFQKIDRVKYSQLKTEEKFFLFDPNWPITPNGSVLIQGTVLSIKSSLTRVTIRRGRFSTDNHEVQFRIVADERCELLNILNGDTLIKQQFRCWGITISTQFTLKLEFPDATTFKATINGNSKSIEMNESYDFEELFIWKKNEFHSVEIKY